MVYPNDKNPKNLVLFYLLPSVPKLKAACGKSAELRTWAPGAEGIVRVGKLKLNFHCFCVCAKYLWPRETIAPFTSAGIPVFFFLLTQCKSGSLYFLHKLLNETAA